ncbi:Mechanosensitive ion channel MscS [Kalmanozyma brasiliensis GHG001]|uniref:EF-hand domain-containing protein n=1 Tax=Kalmanozyma brasiliensis (strain GHG001) TaxID=1365824 RepID=V5EE80_KALBG|nr:Mechanosensitive ion channel MscS [Kalmanozyma brasiliensis GHG001]EST08796.1 Mechanosensitive ion channel MscS [Kalmanozyma brasiliensis GHG001]
MNPTTSSPRSADESLPDSIQNGAASPPYQPRNPLESHPPIYVSQATLPAEPVPNDDHMLHDAAIAAIASGDANLADPGVSHSSSSTDRRTPGLHPHTHDHGILASSANSSGPNSRPSTAGPRVAITDPLADFRDRNLTKPAGLGPKSDFPPHETQRTPGTFNYDRNQPLRPTFSRQDSEVSSTDGGADRDFGDFDWSDEEDLDEAVRFEDEQAKQVRMGRLSLWKILTFLATTFLGNLIISCCLLIPVIVIQYVYRRRGPDEGHRDFVADNVQAWFIWAAFNLHVEWWLHMLVELFPKAVLALIQLIWGRPSQRVLSLAEYFNAIKGYIKLVTYAALSWASWAIIFNSIYNLYNRSDPQNSRASYLYRIYQVIEFFFFFMLTVCAEKVIIKHIAMSFHRSAYAERIAKVTKSLKVFDWLRDHKPRPKSRDPLSAFGLARSACASPSASGAATPIKPTEFILDSDSKDPRNVSDASKSSWLKKHSKKRPSDQGAYSGVNDRAIDVASGKPAEGQAPARGDGKSSLIARVAARGGSRMRVTAAQASTLARVAMNDPFGLLRNETLGIGTDINSPAEAKRLARSLFVAFRGTNRRSYLIPSDFEPAYPDPEDAKDAFSVFDRDGNGDVSQSELKNTVMQVYKERRFLSRSMQDVNHAVGQLDGIFMFVTLIIVMFEALAIFRVDISKTLTTFYSLAIAFAFIFKESAANVFDSIIFIFVTHPFDTGDRIQIGETVLVVKRMSLLSCLFTDSLNQDVYISNVILSATSIVNMRRSGYMWESIRCQFDFNTPLEKLDALEADMIHWLQTEPERLFVPSTAIVPQKIDYMRSLECTIGMTHSDTWQDWGRRFYRKNAFFAAFSYYSKKHGLRYANSVQPLVYWTEDAATLPPSYDPSDPRSTAPRRQDTLGDEDDNGYVLDDFTPSPYSSPQIRAAGGEVALPPKKPKSFMNFTPPADELDTGAENVRLRKVRREAKKLANQGGDGG